jgi:hypothetical protein
MYSIMMDLDDSKRVYKTSSAIGDDTIHIPFEDFHKSATILVSVKDEDDLNIGEVQLDLGAVLEDSPGSFSYKVPINCNTFSCTLIYQSFLSQSMFQQQPMTETKMTIVLKVLSLELENNKNSGVEQKIKISFQKFVSNEENTVTEVALPPSRTSYRFWFPTEVVFPGSSYLKISDTDFAHLDYYIFGKIDHGDAFDPFIELPIIILPALPLPQISLLHPISHHSENVQVREKNGTLSGNIKCQLILDRAVYAPGEAIIASGSNVVNLSKHNAVVKMNLIRKVELGSSSPCSKVQTQLFPLYEGLCNHLSSLELVGSTINVPAIAPTFFGNPNGSPQSFTFSYSVSLEVNIQGDMCCSSQIPVLISALPPKRIYLASFSSKFPNHGPIDINSSSITEEIRSDLVSHKSTVEEGDKIVTAIDHFHNIYELQENDFGEHFGVNPFRPSVLMSCSRSKVDSLHEPEITSRINHESAMTEILKNLEKELDSHRVITDWIKEHPTILDELSPEEMLRIFQNMKVQVYIPCIAREIVQHSNKLTTMHVRQIMNAFPRFRAQVAKLMLPYVVDSQSIDEILSLLNVSDRKEISRILLLSVKQV